MFGDLGNKMCTYSYDNNFIFSMEWVSFPFRMADLNLFIIIDSWDA